MEAADWMCRTAALDSSINGCKGAFALWVIHCAPWPAEIAEVVSSACALVVEVFLRIEEVKQLLFFVLTEGSAHSHVAHDRF